MHPLPVCTIRAGCLGGMSPPNNNSADIQIPTGMKPKPVKDPPHLTESSLVPNPYQFVQVPEAPNNNRRSCFVGFFN